MSHVRPRGRPGARMRVACALAVGTASLLAAALPAPAQEGSYVPDPQTTNIPYTAWAGTQLRLVKCSDALEDTKVNGVFAEVESWSGDQDTRPQVIEQSIAFFHDDDGTRCVRFNAVSLGEGLARIKLKTYVKPNQTELLEHQFIAIWMRLGTPAIDEVGSADPTGGPVGSESEVGDPLGDGSFLPSSRNGRIQVTLTGSFPFRGSTVTLPSGWPALAAMLATDADPTNENPAMRWDIHDDTLKTEGHANGACGASVLTIDAVDNCRGGGERGPFSRVFGDLSFPVVGPFDPLRTETLLSDGKLDAGDAPMPAARVDVKIAPNTPGEIDGAGALEKADKSEVYSRDGNGTDSAHNLYAPFYKQWLPATGAEQNDPAASGTDWDLANNFPGAPFVKYDNWDTFPLTTVIGTDTGCNRTVGFDGEEGDEPRQTPSGDQRVAVFTDEHGEAQVEFEPYAGGFYYDAVGAIHNDNRGCDLQDVRTLGTASITAQAKYVGQPNDFPEPVSAALVKTIGNEFDKSLAYYPKGPGAANANARIIVAHGQDVDGSPFAGERVCFYVDDEADSYRLFSGMTGPADARFRVSTAQAGTPSGLDPDVRCAYLDQYGNAALEVFNSDPQSINVIAEYIDEGLLRDRDLEFGTPGSGDPEPPPNTPPDNGSGGGNNGGTTPPTIRTIIKVIGNDDAGRLLGGAKGASGKKKSARIASARIVTTKKGRYLVVKVVAKAKKATIKVRMKMRSGKVRRVTHKVRTNRKVRVMRLSKAVKSVKVSLAK